MNSCSRSKPSPLNLRGAVERTAATPRGRGAPRSPLLPSGLVAVRLGRHGDLPSVPGSHRVGPPRLVTEVGSRTFTAGRDSHPAPKRFDFWCLPRSIGRHHVLDHTVKTPPVASLPRREGRHRWLAGGALE